MGKLPERLRENVRILGDLLGETLLEHEGPALFRKVEEIRALAKSLNKGTASDASQLVDLLSQLEDKDILPIVREIGRAHV